MEEKKNKLPRQPANDAEVLARIEASPLGIEERIHRLNVAIVAIEELRDAMDTTSSECDACGLTHYADFDSNQRAARYTGWIEKMDRELRGYVDLRVRVATGGSRPRQPFYKEG